MTSKVQRKQVFWRSGRYVYATIDPREIPTGDADVISSPEGTWIGFYYSGSAADSPFYNTHPTLAGGQTVAANCETNRTWVNKTKASGAPNFVTDSLDAEWQVSQLNTANKIRMRVNADFNPINFLSGPGADPQEVFLIPMHTDDHTGAGGESAHYLFFVYWDGQAWTNVNILGGDCYVGGGSSAITDWSDIPGTNPLFDIWIPASLDFHEIDWEASLVQDVDLIGVSGTSVVKTLVLNESTIDTANKANGTDAFVTIDLSNVPDVSGPVKILTAFRNGVEIKCTEYSAKTGGAATDDVVFVDASPTNRANFNFYWNGSGAGGTDSSLGDADTGDLIRVHYLVTVAP